MKIMLEELGKLFVRENLGRLAIAENIESLERYNHLGVNHHLGGTRIGSNPNFSVVDNNLKIIQWTCIFG